MCSNRRNRFRVSPRRRRAAAAQHGARHQWMFVLRISKAIHWFSATLLAVLPNPLPAEGEALEPNQPPPEQGEIQIPLFPLPRTVGVGQYRVTIRNPDDPEESLLGGSGGPILYLTVAGPEFSIPIDTQIQTIWLYATDNREQPPTFTLWSKTGVSNPVRCRLEWQSPSYCVTECQDFEIGREGMFSVGSARLQPPCEP